MAEKKTEKKKTTAKKPAPRIVDVAQLGPEEPVKAEEPVEIPVPTPPPAPEPKPTDRIRIYIPLDPTDISNHQVWERCYNGVNYRVKRGVWTSVPRFIADLIEEQQHIEREAADTIRRLSRMKDLGDW